MRTLPPNILSDVKNTYLYFKVSHKMPLDIPNEVFLKMSRRRKT